MKRLIALTLMLFLTLSLLAACSGGGSEDSSGNSQGGNSHNDGTKVGDVMTFAGYSWLVLDIQENNILVISENIIDLRAFDWSSYVEDRAFDSFSWEYSDVRAWLNNGFLDEFSEDEKDRIAIKKVENKDNPCLDISGDSRDSDYIPFWSETYDKVFLLSLDEVLKYFGDSGMLNRLSQESGELWEIDDEYNENRISKMSLTKDKIEEMWRISSVNGDDTRYNEFLYNLQEDNGKPAKWWLRTKAPMDNCVYVRDDGIIDVYGVDICQGLGEWAGEDYNSDYTIGIRPAMWISIEP